MRSLQRRTTAHGRNERMPIGEGRGLRHPCQQCAGRRDDARHHQPVDIAVAQIPCHIERKTNTAFSNFLDRGKALREHIGYSVRIYQTRQYFVSQDSTPCRFFSAAYGRAESVGRGVGCELFSLRDLVNGSRSLGVCA